jgi:hypothetical protein
MQEKKNPRMKKAPQWRLSRSSVAVGSKQLPLRYHVPPPDYRHGCMSFSHVSGPSTAPTSPYGKDPSAVVLYAPEMAVFSPRHSCCVIDIGPDLQFATVHPSCSHLKFLPGLRCCVGILWSDEGASVAQTPQGVVPSQPTRGPHEEAGKLAGDLG